MTSKTHKPGLFHRIRSNLAFFRAWYTMRRGGGIENVSLDRCPWCRELALVIFMDLDRRRRTKCLYCGHRSGIAKGSLPHNAAACGGKARHEDAMQDSLSSNERASDGPDKKVFSSQNPLSNPRSRLLIPLLLTRDPETIASANSREHKELRLSLSTKLNAEEMPIDEIDDLLTPWPPKDKNGLLPSPSVFIVYFNEHGPLSAIASPAFELLTLNGASPALFFCVMTIGKSPLRVKLEETYLLNYGRPFFLFDASLDDDDIGKRCAAAVAPLFDQSENIFLSLYENEFPEILSSRTSFILVPFLRIFREDPTTTAFYAALEYLLMINHLLSIFRIASVSDTRDRNMLHDLLWMTRRNLSDGRISQILQSSLRGPASVIDGMLESDIDKSMNDALLKVLANTDSAVPFSRYPQWRDLCASTVTIRNATKGHGIVYEIDCETTRAIVEIAVGITKEVVRQAWVPIVHFNGQWKELRCEPFHYGLETTEAFDATWSARMGLSLNDHIFDLGLLAHSPALGYSLFEGLSDDSLTGYYKNYATGVHLQRDLRGRNQESSMPVATPPGMQQEQ